MGNYKVQDVGIGLNIISENNFHPMSYAEGEEFEKLLRRLLQHTDIDTYEVALPENGGVEKVIITRDNAYHLWVTLKRIYRVK